jgi:hypothetical protein
MGLVKSVSGNAGEPTSQVRLAWWNTTGLARDVAATSSPPADPNAGWLAGSDAQKFATVERHFRGLDVAMAEIGYRYGELIHAQKDRNWEYAKYQAEKIDLALRLALERRPKRAESSRPFLDQDLKAVLESVQGKDPVKLDGAMERLHAGCVECHRKENVLYFKGAVAIATTKLPILEKDGFWKMAHESRTDFSMLTGSLFLFLRGGGRWSFDRWLTGRIRRSSKPNGPYSAGVVS